MTAPEVTAAFIGLSGGCCYSSKSDNPLGSPQAEEVRGMAFTHGKAVHNAGSVPLSWPWRFRAQGWGWGRGARGGQGWWWWCVEEKSAWASESPVQERALCRKRLRKKETVFKMQHYCDSHHETKNNFPNASGTVFNACKKKKKNGSPK